jgi:MraZ protein
MVSFYSKYSAIVDSKGRIVLPAPLKKEMGDALETVFVVEKDPYDKCLNIYPQSSWQAKVEKMIKKLNMDDQIQGMMLSRIYEEIVTVHMAENGRLNIPNEMLEHAGITKEAIFTGQGSRMRLWEPSRHKASRLSDEAYANLYKEYLGGPMTNL